MSLLVETIRTENGRLLNICLHNERIIRSLYGVFGLRKIIDLEKIITVPEYADKGIFKCRVEYDREIRKVEFLPYRIKKISSLKLVDNDYIEYGYKYIERGVIEELMSRKEDCDDIIIVKNGNVTDSSFANLIFLDPSGKWVTPSTYLLNGTKRSSLLQNGVIIEKAVSHKDITYYSEVKLINAMLNIDDTEGIPVKNIC